jgi:hypothetical protein
VARLFKYQNGRKDAISKEGRGKEESSEKGCREESSSE